MEEAELSLESKEARLKDDTDPPDGAVIKVCTEIKNGNGNMEEVKNYENENDSSEEFKAVVNLKEVKDREERIGVKQIESREEDKNIEETKVVIEKESMKAVDVKEKEDVDSHDMVGKENLEKTNDEEEKKEVEVQNVNEVKIGLEGKDREVNSVLESVEVARDKKTVEAVEGVECNNDKNGLGDDEAVGRKSEEEGRNSISDKSVNELENHKVEEGVEEMKDIEHGKARSVDKDEESILVQVETSDGGKARKEAKDIEMCGAEDVVEKEAADVKAEGKLVVREGEEVKKDDGGNADKTVGDNQNKESVKRKRGRAQGPSEASEAKKSGGTKENVEETEVEGSTKNSKDVLSSPVVSSSDRPMRERKTVERWVEVIEKAPDRTVIIEKGRGTPLIEIPNVANNLARKKPAELKFLHQTLFGRKGKAVDFKSNLLQFSGFTWHESEEKQRAKTKEKLDKCVKETLLELCDLFDLTISKTNTKKDEIIVKLLDFMEAPHAMGDVMHAEKQSSKSSKSRKRERAPEVDASKGSGGNFEKKSRQKHEKTEGTPNSDVKSSHDTEDDDEVEDLKEDEDEDEDSEEQSQKEDETRSHSKIDAEEKELEETDDEEEDESEFDADLRKGKKVKKSPKGKENKYVKKSPRLQTSSDTEKRKNGSNSKKNSPKTDGKSSLKTPPSKHSKAEKSNDTGEKALSRKKKDSESPKKSNSKSNSKEKSSGKASKSKTKSGKVQKSGPSKAELLKSISEILKKVDFNTATFTDILELLGSEYKIDLTPRKAAIKIMIQDELTKMVDDEEESQDEEEMQ